MRPILALLEFTIRQILVGRKVWLTALLLAAPAALLLIIRNFGPPIDQPRTLWEMYQVLTQFMLIMGLVPLVCLVHGTAMIGAEVEAGTIVYLITRRMRRATVLLVKFFVTAIVLAVLCDVAMVGVHLCVFVGRDVPTLTAGTELADWNPTSDLSCYLIVIPLAVLGFLSVFTLIGLLTARPLALSVIYLVTVELILSNIPVRARVYSVLHPLRVMMADRIPGADRLYELPRTLHDELYGTGASALPQLLATVLVALVLAGVLISLRELVAAKVSRD